METIDAEATAYYTFTINDGHKDFKLLAVGYQETMDREIGLDAESHAQNLATIITYSGHCDGPYSIEGYGTFESDTKGYSLKNNAGEVIINIQFDEIV